jgi:hypothetical protein
MNLSREQTTPEPEHRVMWENGPTRRFSDSRTSMPYDKGGFVGNYVCQVCNDPCQGVYIAKSSSRNAGRWICGDCRNAETAEKATPRKRIA